MMKGSATLVLRYLKQRGAVLTRVDSSRVSSSYRILSTSALPDANADHHESEKMMSEGGGSTRSFDEKKDEMKTIGVSDANQPSKGEWQETKDAVADVSGRAKNKLNEAKDTGSENAKAASGKTKDKLHEAKNAASENVKAASDAAKDKLYQAKDRMSDGMNAASDKAKGVSEDASNSMNAASDKAKDVSEDAMNAAGKKAGQGQSFMGKVSEQAKKEMNTSADMMKDIPQKVSETAQGLKEVGVEAAKAVKRDAGRVAEKIGLKDPS